MVDEEFGGADEDASFGPKKGGNLKLIIIIVVIGIIMGAGGFFAGKIISGGGDKGKDQVQGADPAKKDEVKKDNKAKPAGKENAGDKTVKEGGDTAKETPQGTQTPTGDGGGRGILPLDPFTVNLNDPFGRRYIEVELKLVIDKKDLVEKIRNNELIMPRIRNEILMTLSSRSYNDLRTVAGKVTLFEEIQMRVNEVLKQELGLEPVIEVLQTKFLMQ
jgi:flagellar FliL protein